MLQADNYLFIFEKLIIVTSHNRHTTHEKQILIKQSESLLSEASFIKSWKVQRG